MLKELRIKNYAIIDELSIDFKAGLNILTGETGAGKSIIIESLGLILGERASDESIRSGEDSASVEAVFDISQIKKIREILAKSGIETEDNERIQIPYRPQKLFYYMQTYTFEPSFIVDVSDSFEQKMKAVKAFKTQFFDSNSKEPETFISRPEFFSYLISRAQFYGFQIGKHYGEPFYCEEKIEYNMSWLL